MAEHASASWGYAAAALGAAVALACVRRLPTDAPRAGGPAPSLFASARAGVVFVLEHGLLRGIFFCAVFWNFAFFALLALWVPFALGPLGLGAAGAGAAQSAYGAGLIAGALAAPLVARRLPPGATMIFGPASSILAAAALLTAPRLGDAIASFGAAATAHFVVGFGPMLWLIAQTTIRQLVTPAALLGRVNAAVQVAIYGVRPLGALAGGTLADARLTLKSPPAIQTLPNRWVGNTAKTRGSGIFAPSTDRIPRAKDRAAESVMLKIIITCIIAAAAFAATAPAQAGSWTGGNGVSVNGISPNALTHKALTGNANSRNDASTDAARFLLEEIELPAMR